MVSSKDTLAFSLFDSSTEEDIHGFYDDDMSITDGLFEDVGMLNDLGLGSENEEMIEDTNRASVHQRSHQERISFMTTISDDELEKMPIQDLNKHLRGLPETFMNSVRRKRRILKSRKYSLKFRQKGSVKKNSIASENEEIELEIDRAKEQLRKVQKERDKYRLKYAELKRLVDTSDLQMLRSKLVA